MKDTAAISELVGQRLTKVRELYQILDSKVRPWLHSQLIGKREIRIPDPKNKAEAGSTAEPM